MFERKSSVIILPQDKILREKLDLKLKAHKEVFHQGAPLKPQMYIFCVIKILERLLKDGRVMVWDISKEIFEEYRADYDPDAFLSACLFIENYCIQASSMRPRIGYPPPVGRKVRLLIDYQIGAHAPAEKITINATGVAKNILTVRINITIPAGTVGVVAGSDSSMRSLNYDLECLMLFNDHKIPVKTVIIPWDILEYAD